MVDSSPRISNPLHPRQVTRDSKERQAFQPLGENAIGSKRMHSLKILSWHVDRLAVVVRQFAENLVSVERRVIRR